MKLARGFVLMLWPSIYVTFVTSSVFFYLRHLFSLPEHVLLYLLHSPAYRGTYTVTGDAVTEPVAGFGIVYIRRNRELYIEIGIWITNLTTF
ncbi:hypothetical protein V8F20_006036 [Naviculisporaceae sp. PSN 640]